MKTKAGRKYMILDADNDEDGSLRQEATNRLRSIMRRVEQVAVTARCAEKTRDDVNDRVTEVFELVLEALGLPEDADYPFGPWMDELTP
jgi:hypothetical protein